MHYKIEVSCLGILDSKKVKVLQKTENGLDKVHPLYIPVMPSSTTTIGKLQFSRSTPSNKARNLSDPYFQVVVRVSAVTLTRSEFEIVSYTSENLSVLSGTPAQYSLDREPKYKYLPNQSYVNRFRSFSPKFNISSVQADGKLPEINNLHLFNEQQFTCPINTIGKQYFGDSSSSDGENTVKLEPMGVDLALAPETTNNPCYFQDPVDHLLYNFFNGF
ncbi:hypothetical protein HDV04_001340 [Boothiomyces sp. JEL0838]|nr:hypothetical protein HDV04_001340 [Boothiomyces sp. JEL0838]